MKKPILYLSVMMLSWFVLSGCKHYEFPNVPGAGTTDEDDNGVAKVDMNGVNDGVNSKRIVVDRVPFPAHEYARLKKSGDSTVKGQISIIYNGTKIPGKSTRLYLNPVTSYSNQWYREGYLAGHKLGKSDPRLFNYLKFTASDNSGNFAFYGVAGGNYYLVGSVKCDACGGKIVRVAKRISVGEHKTVTISLNRELR